MALPSLFSSTQPDSARKLLIGILISSTSVQASLWEVVDGSVVVLEHSDVRQYTDGQDLVVQTDKSLQDLGKDSENVDEVIFGLEPEWVGKTGIVDDRKPLLKKITDELSLKAVGFVVTVEALLHHLVQMPDMQSLILVNFDPKEMHVSLIKQGKVAGTKKVGRSGQTAADLREALARFETATAPMTLPLKVLLFSTTLSDEELSAEEQNLLNYDWLKDGVFVQTPVFELLPPNLLIDVVSREGGKAVAQSLGLITPDPSSAGDKADGTALPTSFGIPIKDAVPTPEAVVPETAVVAGATVIKPTTVMPPKTDLSDAEVDSTENKPSLMSKLMAMLPMAKLSHGAVVSDTPSAAHPLTHKKFMIGGFIAGIVALFLVGYGFLFLSSKATLALELKTMTVAQEVNLKLDPTISVADTSQLLLPAKTVSQEVTGSDSTVTTGTKLVGDPAKGTVTLFNKTTSAKTFSSGTQLSSGKLHFTLDSEVTVASASVATDSSAGSETKTFGKADAKITATDIGTESNLGKDTNFTVANFDSSTYGASNDAPLSGGQSREVRVVSADDRKNLELKLKNQLVSDAQAKFKTSASNGTFVAATGKFTITSETFGAKVGDETNQLTLDLTGTAEGLAYQNQDLQPIAQSVLQSQIPSGYELVPNEMQVLSTPTSASSTSAQVALAANLSSPARPILNLDDLKKSLAGKSLGDVEKNLKANASIKAFTITFDPSLAKRILGRLPAAARLNITVK